jgi:hypothetical protein
MAVPIQTAPTFSAATRVEAVRGSFYAPALGRCYDVSPHGKRFLVIKDAVQTAAVPSQLVVVLNWFEALKARVPTK